MHCSRLRGGARRAAVSLLLVRLLAGSMLAPTAALAFEDVEVGAIVRNQVSAEEHPESPAIWMGRHRQVSLDGTGNLRVTEHHLLRVFDQSWAGEALRPYRIFYWNETEQLRPIRLRIWKSPDEPTDLPPDAVTEGATEHAERHDAYAPARELRIDFGEIESGQVIEIAYERDVRVRPGELNVRWFAHEFGDELPTKEEQFTFRLPTAYEPTVIKLGKPLISQLQKRGSFRVFNWLTGDLPAYPVAPVDGPVSRAFVDLESAIEDAPEIVFGVPDWAYLSGYLGRYWGSHIQASGPILSAVVTEAVSGATDPTERVRRIERFVQEEIETVPLHHIQIGIRPIDVEKVLASRAGTPRDKTCLMVAMLQAAGMRSTPALLRTRPGAWVPESACPDQLDRFVLEVQLPDDQTLWCDPVDDVPLPETDGWYIGVPPAPNMETKAGLFIFPGRP